MLLGCSMTSFALFDKIKKEIKWREEEQPRFNKVKVMIDGKEKMRKVIPGNYEIKLFEITYPTDLFGKNRFYNEFNAFLKDIKKGKKYSLLLEERFYQEMQDIKVDQLSEEEKILELPASEDQAILPELQRNVYLTDFPSEIIEKLAKNQLKLKRTPLLLENSEYHGYTYNENNTVVFVGGKKPKYYYNDYKINVVRKPIAVLDLLKTSSNYYVSDFF